MRKQNYLKNKGAKGMRVRVGGGQQGARGHCFRRHMGSLWGWFTAGGWGGIVLQSSLSDMLRFANFSVCLLCFTQKIKDAKIG